MTGSPPASIRRHEPGAQPSWFSTMPRVLGETRWPFSSFPRVRSVTHVQFDAARDDVIGQPPPVLTGHAHPLPEGGEGFSSYSATVTSDLHISSDTVLLRYFASFIYRYLHHDRNVASETFPNTGFLARLIGDRCTTWMAAEPAGPELESHGRD